MQPYVAKAKKAYSTNVIRSIPITDVNNYEKVTERELSELIAASNLKQLLTAIEDLPACLNVDYLSDCFKIKECQKDFDYFKEMADECDTDRKSLIQELQYFTKSKEGDTKHITQNFNKVIVAQNRKQFLDDIQNELKSNNSEILIEPINNWIFIRNLLTLVLKARYLYNQGLDGEEFLRTLEFNEYEGYWLAVFKISREAEKQIQNVYSIVKNGIPLAPFKGFYESLLFFNSSTESESLTLLGSFEDDIVRNIFKLNEERLHKANLRLEFDQLNPSFEYVVFDLCSERGGEAERLLTCLFNFCKQNHAIGWESPVSLIQKSDTPFNVVSNSLLAKFMQIAFSVEADSISLCSQCGLPIIDFGKKINSEYCSDACRVRAARERNDT